MGSSSVPAPLAGRVALVTGASQGVGRAIALAYAAQGAELVLAARNVVALEAVAAEATALGTQVHAIPCDVTDIAQVEALAYQARERTGGVSILVNNAGIAGSHRLIGHPDELWDRIIAVNLTAVFRTTRAIVVAPSGGVRFLVRSLPHHTESTMTSCFRSRFSLLALAVIVWSTSAHLPAQEAAAASSAANRMVNGRVSNAATGVRLEGARVELQGTGRSVTTDAEGRYLISAAAADSAIVISYPGMDNVTIPLRATDAAAVTHDVAMTSDIYKMQAFTVEGEREGSAMATARQRQASNVKNVVATDAFGTMTEDNVGSFLQKIPGIVATDLSGSGVREVQVRGIEAGLNTVEMDGVQLANNNSSGTNRAFDFFQASLSLIESIEVTKAPTPDRPANSIGGSINMVTRSAFNRNSPRQIRYSLGFAHTIGRKGGEEEQWIDSPIDKLTPALTLAYSDVFGPNRNLGVSLSYSRNSVF